MRVQRQRRATTGLVVLAVLLGLVWAGAPTASGAGSPVDRMASSGSTLGVEAAVPPDRAPVLRPTAERPDRGGRLLPLLLGMVVAALVASLGPGARWLRSGLAPVGPLARPPRLDARAPPTLQPA
jgi:hypothetical protein